VQRDQPEAVELPARSRQLVAARSDDPNLAALEEQHRARVRTRLDQRLIEDVGTASLRTLLVEDSDEGPAGDAARDAVSAAPRRRGRNRPES